jgi:MinD-like ATPase involved in chromosome partitioning or flagellar assembly
MTREQLKEALSQNLLNAGLRVVEVRAQKDPHGGWRIAVVSPDFAGRLPDERKTAALNNLDLEVEWIDLLTPEEREWAGTLPADLDVKQLPLWPQALAASSDAPLRFSSDLDEDLNPPIRTTFYSLRGGVGRSTALAYTAKLLGSRGRKVVCIDMDLEAPGLAALFGKENEVVPGQGVVAALLAIERGEEIDLARHLLRVSESDDVYCIPAGLPSAEYARLLAQLDPVSWYREDVNPLRRFIDAVENRLPFRPDAVLIDARTGITPLSAPLLFDLADLAVVVFFPHPQTAIGTRALVRALLAAHSGRVLNGHHLTPEPRFLISPVPASKAPEVVQKYRNRALEWIEDWLAPARAGSGGENAFVQTDITHFVPYRESFATADSITLSEDAVREFAPVADWIERFLPTRSEQRAQAPVHERKAPILAELRFSSGTAEEQDNLLETFVETETVRQALDPAMPLVVGRKGTGKTAIFRRLKEDTARSSVVVQAPSSLVGEMRWILGPDGFREIDAVLGRRRSSWRQFWAYYIHLALQHSDTAMRTALGPGDQELNDVLQARARTELDVVKNFESLLGRPNSSLVLNDLLDRLDQARSQVTLLLFDGLDTGFGISEDDRVRRARAIEGLFAFWTDRGERVKNLRFKILLREDIWRGLAFENKSHLFGRTVALKWADQTAFFKVVMKQAVLSTSFRQQMSLLPGGERWSSASIDNWSEQEVFAAWNVLVGERMKGGRTTFTRNWVWNRLADANDDHSPMYLLQLFAVATDWERAEQMRAAYDRSVIRPRALIASLPEVSEQAFDALSREEFPELGELLQRLKEIGRTPVSAELLKGIRGADLALEVGLLGEYELGSSDNVERYRVPEIYRYGLNMTRKGQA